MRIAFSWENPFMNSSLVRRGLSMAALAAAMILASCESGPSAAELEAQRLAAEAAAAAARKPPAIALNESVAQAASIYVTFMRDTAQMRGGFTSAEAIQEALRKGTAYDPAQLSRGMIAYAAIIALQSPEFVAGVGQYGINPAQRQQMIAAITADPAYAAVLPGAEHAAGLIIATLARDITALSDAAESIEADAYTIQERNDPRRSWAVAHIADRSTRLQGAKTNSAGIMLPSADEAAALLAAATSGSGLSVEAVTRRPPYTPAVANALAIAALAALGAAGDEARTSTDALQTDSSTEFCLNISKLNLYQCLAASRPSYEDMFCVGRHVVRDLASCTQGSAVVIPTGFVSDPVTSSRPPAITSTPIASPAPAPSSAASPTTSSLNSGRPYRPN